MKLQSTEYIVQPTLERNICLSGEDVCVVSNESEMAAPVVLVVVLRHKNNDKSSKSGYRLWKIQLQ